VGVLQECEWVRNDRNWAAGEVVLGEAASREECAEKVKKEVDKTSGSRCVTKSSGKATIANFMEAADGMPAVCRCQWGADMEEEEGAAAWSCLLRTKLNEEQAKQAARVDVATICKEFVAKRPNVDALSPGVLRWLDAQGQSRKGARAAAAFIDKLNANVDFASDRANVDLCDTHMNQSSVLEFYCMLMGIKDPGANVNALSSQLCPRVVDDLTAAAATDECRNTPDSPAVAAPGFETRRISQRAECQVKLANKQLRERVQQNTALQLVANKTFLQLLPQNFSSLRMLSGRIAKGLFSPAKELTRCLITMVYIRALL